MKAFVCRFLIVCCLATIASCSKPQPMVVRYPVFEGADQKEIDDTHRAINESTKNGRGEVKNWNERYLGENPALPYQGPRGGARSGL